MTLHGSVFGRTLQNVRWDTLMYTHPPLLKQIFDRVYSGVGGHSARGGFWCLVLGLGHSVLILTRLRRGPPLNVLAFIKWNTNKFTQYTFLMHATERISTERLHLTERLIKEAFYTCSFVKYVFLAPVSLLSPILHTMYS